jgi:hypothetical protein
MDIGRTFPAALARVDHLAHGSTRDLLRQWHELSRSLGLAAVPVNEVRLLRAATRCRCPAVAGRTRINASISSWPLSMNCRRACVRPVASRSLVKVRPVRSEPSNTLPAARLSAVCTRWRVRQARPRRWRCAGLPAEPERHGCRTRNSRLRERAAAVAAESRRNRRRVWLARQLVDGAYPAAAAETAAAERATQRTVERAETRIPPLEMILYFSPCLFPVGRERLRAPLPALPQGERGAARTRSRIHPSAGSSRPAAR